LIGWTIRRGNASLKRIGELAAWPFDPRMSAALSVRPGLRRSRVGGWRIIFTVNEASKSLYVVTVGRRGEVYKRL
jgi:mRNA interferase RelE/StbE